MCAVNVGDCAEMVTLSPSESHDNDDEQCSATQCCLVLLNTVRAHPQSINVMRCHADHVVTASNDHTLKVFSCTLQSVIVIVVLLIITGRLKMHEWKMPYGQNCRGGKCRSGKYESRSQGWKMQEWKMREQIARMENAGVSPMDSQTAAFLKYLTQNNSLSL